LSIAPRKEPGFMGGEGGRGNRGRGRGTARVKRREVESENGWTVITHGLARVKIHDGGDARREGKIAGAMPSEVVRDLTAEKLMVEFKKLQERWEDTSVARQIKELISNKTWTVTEAICIGIGSFSRDWEHRWRSIWQLVLFTSIIQHLNSSSSNKTLQVYAQDPAFTPIDIEFLHLLNISTTPSGIESHITPKSFVYSPFVDWFILLPMFLKGKDPVLYVGNEILDDYGAYARSGEKKEKLAECNELGKLFLDGRESVKAKDFQLHAHALNGMNIYWKVTTDNSEPSNEQAPS